MSNLLIERVMLNDSLLFASLVFKQEVERRPSFNEKVVKNTNIALLNFVQFFYACVKMMLSWQHHYSYKIISLTMDKFECYLTFTCDTYN
jgi:hypothetical protein